ncbi:cytochrome P450 [Cyathus striatus]|nr:cytochrome P450 [Cyathus striatus]
MACSAYHLALAIVGICLLWFRRRRTNAPYPPGPPAEPFIGHLQVLPASNQTVAFRRSYLVLNLLKTAAELLDQQSGIYSDQMKLILYELMWTATLTLMPYGKRFQKHRKLFNEYLNEKQLHLIENPDNWMQHLERFAGALVYKIAYGMDIIDNDPYLELSEKALSSLTSCGAAGSTPVDFLPFLTFLPSWQSPDKEHIEDLQGSAGLMFAGGAETTSSALSFFVLAMVLFPEVQEKAQQEIDKVVGKGRLPEMNDQACLPYVEAVMHEVLRWNTIIPMGILHRSIEDNIYNGMYIPKGTVVIANAYAILRDEMIYADPDSFNPSRYLPKPEGNAEPYPLGHFGFGRRICPGQYLADASLFIAITSILAMLDIEQAKDDNGKEIIPDIELMTGVTSHPKPFHCTISAWEKISESLIRQAQLWDNS